MTEQLPYFRMPRLSYSRKEGDSERYFCIQHAPICAIALEHPISQNPDPTTPYRCSGCVANAKAAQAQAKRDSRTRHQRRDKYRGTVCVGCRNSRYNYESAGNGWDAPTTGEGCWSLMSIDARKKVCPCKR